MFDDLLERGRRELKAGKLQEAATHYRAYLESQPRHADALNELSLILYTLGEYAPAAALMRRCIAITPSIPERHLGLGAMLGSQGKIDEGIEALQTALSLRPEYPQALNNMGNLLVEQKRWREATEAFGRALALDPDMTLAHSNLGNLLVNIGRSAEALPHYRRALAMAPQDQDILLGLALALEDCGQYPQAYETYVSLINVNPASFAARVNLAFVLQTMNERDLAWRIFFEAGEWVDPLVARYPNRRWNGSDPAGKTILIHSNHHFGDTLLLARFIPILRQRGAKVILQCRAELLTLLRSVGADLLLSLIDEPPAFDAYLPLWPLPHRLGITQGKLPNLVPYLTPPADRVQYWKMRIPDDDMIKVGIVWAGSESAYRSRTLEIFAPLLAVPGVRFFSLQKGAQSTQKPAESVHWIDLTPEIYDFADTAAFIQHLDLVVSIDTAVAHLAGAMGRPVWTLLPWRANFFWTRDGTATPWYPSMRLFRQKTAGTWDEPIRQMTDALKQFKP